MSFHYLYILTYTSDASWMQNIKLLLSHFFCKLWKIQMLLSVNHLSVTQLMSLVHSEGHRLCEVGVNICMVQESVWRQQGEFPNSALVLLTVPSCLAILSRSPLLLFFLLRLPLHFISVFVLHSFFSLCLIFFFYVLSGVLILPISPLLSGSFRCFRDCQEFWVKRERQ